jgi:hypothetical protein
VAGLIDRFLNRSASLAGAGAGVAGGASIRSTHPILRKKANGYPLPEDPEQRKAEYVDSLLRLTEADALARYKSATKNMLYMNGRQWIDWLVNRRAWDDLPNASQEMRATMNYIRPILRARAARMMPSQVGFTVTPDSNSYEARDKAQIARNLVAARWKQLDMNHKVRTALQLSYCCGFSALKSFWNTRTGTPKAATIMVPVGGVDTPNGPQIQWQEVPCDANGQPVEDISQAYYYRPGDTDTSVRTVFNLRLNPEATGWSEAEGLRYLIDSEVVPIDVARSKFPEIADRIQPMAAAEQYLTYERIAAGGNVQRARGAHTVPVANGSSSQLAEHAVIREWWEMPCDDYPDGRLVVLVGGAQAYDDKFPQGILPYAPIYDELGVLTWSGRSCVNDMISPQDVINREWTAIVREMGQSASGQFVAWNVPGVPDQITTQERGVIRLPMNSYLANRSINDVFKRLDPAQVPADRWHMIQEAKVALFDIGAYHEVSRGQIPPGIDSGVAIQALQESEVGQLKDSTEALRRSMIRWGQHQLSIAKWGYGEEEERAIPVDRPDLKVMIDTVRGDMLPYPETVGLDVENFQPHSEAARRAEVKELGDAGYITPRDVLKALDMGRGVDGALESQTRDYARARRENLDFLAGRVIAIPQGATADEETGEVQQAPPAILHADLTPLLYPADDDHQIHIDVHYEVLKDDAVPFEVRQIVMMHIAEHRMALQMVAMQQMAMAGGPSEGGEGGGDNSNGDSK